MRFIPHRFARWGRWVGVDEHLFYVRVRKLVDQVSVGQEAWFSIRADPICRTAKAGVLLA